MESIAAVVITKDEERNIADCLASVVWVDEIVVVDACSTDRTVELARRFTDKIFVRPWPGYGPQKNFGIEQATADWILIVDADERVSPELQGEIRKIIALPPSDKIFRISACKSGRSEEHTSELQSRPHLVCRLLLGKNK